MKKNPLDLDDIFDLKLNQFSANINCIQIGKIESYDVNSQACEIQIQVKRRLDNQIIDYPLLVECPVIILQGGKGFLEFPISQGDYCLVLFNDRDIENWYVNGSYKEPKTKRKHSLSDGFALVGINPKISVLNLDGENVNLWGPGESDRIQIKPDGKIEVGSGGAAAARENDPIELLMSAVDIQTLAVSLLATGAFLPTGSPPVPGTPVNFTGGKITTGSTEVTIK